MLDRYIVYILYIPYSPSRAIYSTSEVGITGSYWTFRFSASRSQQFSRDAEHPFRKHLEVLANCSIIRDKRHFINMSEVDEEILYWYKL